MQKRSSSSLVMAESDSGLVSPTAQSPTPPTTQAYAVDDIQQSKLWNGFSKDGRKAPLSYSPLVSPKLVLGSNNAAHDYLNGGMPHEDGVEGVAQTPSRPLAPAASASRLQSAVRASPSVLHERNASLPGPSTPPTGRRSVQFARSNTGGEGSTHTRHDSWGPSDPDAHRGVAQSIMEKLKSLASTSSHVKNQHSGISEDGAVSAQPSNHPETLEEEGSDMDADAEETADEEDVDEFAARTRRKKRFRRPQNGPQTAPTTPRMIPRDRMRGPKQSDSHLRPTPFLRRRNTDGMEDEERGGVSEGEGRDRLGKESAWRRGSSWIRNQSYSGAQQNDVEDTPTGRRPSAFRRAVSTFGAQSDNEGGRTPRRPFMSGERGTTFGAHKWRQLKQGLKLLGQRREEHKIDYLKSAELMAELRAGAPAALMFASMIQRDDHGNKRIPVLLEQLKVQITDSTRTDIKADHDKESDRHVVFRIELEYGSGLNRMKWVIHRSLTEFMNLHLRYKLQRGNDKYLQLKSDVNARPKQPHFPASTFPYLRAARGLGEDSSDEEAVDPIADDTAPEATHSEAEGRKRKKRRPSITSGRRSTTMIVEGSNTAGEVQRSKAYNLRQRKKLEQYLLGMIRWLIFRADSNRLCKWLELSALGVRLAAEGSYHGKEGFLLIQSSAVDFKKLIKGERFINKHLNKWFIVRHSYIVCVDGPENMHIHDVFLLDSNFELQSKKRTVKDFASSAKTSATKHHRLKLKNSERTMKLLSSKESMIRQFEDSINYMIRNSNWALKNRFDSFAPVRTGVHAQWLVDGRDYTWNVSRAIDMAKDVIYIHDWWLSPQLYMRRPAAISQKWRLDRLLRRKAREGVKIFIIIYRNVEAAVPIDSEFTKASMLDLHPNIFVQRSPNQFKKNQFFFAHHEKICIIDHNIAFVGGVDLCFGRWDTPQHSVVDDRPTGFEQTDMPKDADHCQLWPGKDYSNPRVQDFYKLHEPYAEMYDRSKTPRMPWHDVAMQVVGQPARDMTRHFVQRWNYVLRGRSPTRPTPLLLPPPDFTSADLEALGLTGTCEVQVLRSASNWSLGLEKTEHSIMTAYCKMIEESDHFVYMENQFFITSCEALNVKIVNKIGDAIIERALRASRNNENWRCIILIPLMPGFQNTVDQQDGTSVRLIMECQFRSICRGSDSIFGRLRREGLEPEDFVQFYSLRTWGKIGPTQALVTEQLYIHAKVIVVDDRVALIGSANINERSMLGNRDSECAAVVRDTDMIKSTMGGKEYLVGRFAHTLRMRLMREHLGLDVDEVMEEERRAKLDREEAEYESAMDRMYDGQDEPDEATERKRKSPAAHFQRQASATSFNHNVECELEESPKSEASKHKATSETRVTGNRAEVDGESKDQWKLAASSGLDRGRDSMILDGGHEVLVRDLAPEGKGTIENPKKPHDRISPPSKSAETAVDLSKDWTISPLLPSALPLAETGYAAELYKIQDESGQPLQVPASSILPDLKTVFVHKDCMRDPLNDTFFEDTWQHIADSNTKIFRHVFRCHPDSEITTWAEYREFDAYAERFSQAQFGGKSKEREAQEAQGRSGPPGAGTAMPGSLSSAAAKMKPDDSDHPMGTVKEWADDAEAEHRARPDTSNAGAAVQGADGVVDEKSISAGDQLYPTIVIDAPNSQHKERIQREEPAVRRRRRNTTTRKGFSGSDDLMSYKEAEALLGKVQGHLVNFPYDWLHREDWMFQVDQVAPLQIYN